MYQFYAFKGRYADDMLVTEGFRCQCLGVSSAAGREAAILIDIRNCSNRRADLRACQIRNNDKVGTEADPTLEMKFRTRN